MKRSSRANDSARRVDASGLLGPLALALALTAGGATPAFPRAPEAPSPSPAGGPGHGDWTMDRPAPTDSSGADSTGPQVRRPGTRSEADGLPIASIQIVPRNIFDPLPADRFTPIYRLANKLHVRTRARAIREQLLFSTGERWSDAEGRETARNLRALDFLSPERIEARRRGDSVDVMVVTRDIWTTQAEFNLESAGGRQYGALAFTERNLFGLGKSLSLSYNEDASGTTRGFSVDDPGVLGSRVRLRYAATNGSSGATDVALVELPFYAEDTPHSYGASWGRAASVVRLYQRDRQVAEFDQRSEQVETWWGAGRRSDGIVERVVGSLLIRDRRYGATRYDSDAPEEFVGGEEDLRLRRVAIEGRLWQPRFVERTYVNRMAVIEDFDLGPSVTLKLGLAPKFLGSTAEEGYVQMGMDAGAGTRSGFGFVRGSSSARVRRGLKEAVTRLEARWFEQSGRRTMVFAAHGVAGDDADRGFQTMVGGLNGLRGYPVHAVAGRRLARLNLEQRWMVRETAGGFIALGAVGFVDAARGWGPGSGGAGWFSSAGVGVRLALPRWSPQQIIRVDLAWPLSPARDEPFRPVLSFGSSQAF